MIRSLHHNWHWALYMFILSHHLYQLSVMDKLCPQTVVLLGLWLVHISTLRIYTESQSNIGCFLASNQPSGDFSIPVPSSKLTYHIPFLKALFESMFFRTSRLVGYGFRSLEVSIDHRASDADEEAENEK